MNKLIAHVAAAMLTCSVMLRLGARANAVADPTLKDPNEQSDALTAWEYHRSFYAAIVGATKDSTNWPAPADDKPAAPVKSAPVVAPTPAPTVTVPTPIGPLPVAPIVNAVADTVNALSKGN